MINTAIVTRPIQTAEILEGFTSSRDGACLLFLGVVRDHNQGREVDGLDYEAYETMAEKTLAEIAEEASRNFETDRITVLHRVGTLGVGEVSTAIAVATPHRAQAYQASRYIIEELKRRLPVWKREHYLEGDSAWLGGGGAELPPGGDALEGSEGPGGVVDDE